jgi:hypothetical protein
LAPRPGLALLGLGIAGLLACSFIFPGANSLAQPAVDFTYVLVDGNGPEGIWLKTVGDVNGDDLLDLVAGGVGSGGLVWYENPDWTKHVVDPGGGFSTDGEMVDVDNDGDNDLVILTTSDIRWYENPGWEMHGIEDRVLHDVEVADFDGDGKVDLVARNQGEFGGQGDELHFYRQSTPTSWQHRSVSTADGEGLTVADIDRDNDLDVVVNGRWHENTRDILNGAWTAYPYTASYDHPNAYVSSGDINGDGRTDIVLAPAELEGGTYRISWFEAPANPRSPNWTEHIVEDDVETVHHFVGAADMDNDGDVDIASAEMQQGTNPDEIKVYFNEDGDGTVWTKQVIRNTGSHSMRLLDFDGDGDMDLYGANWQGDQVELFENLTCQSSLNNWQRYVIDPNRPWRSIFIAAADVDEDGLQDVLTGGWWYKNPGAAQGNWPRNTIGSPLNNLAAVFDFDGDGREDVLGTMGQGSDSNPQFVWARNNGSGNFSVIENVEAGQGDFLQGVAVGTLEAGGDDVVALSWHSAGVGLEMLSVPADPLNDTWLITGIAPTSQDEALSMGDIDRDGDRDLLLGTIWLENQGDSWVDHVLHNTDGASYGESDPDRNRLADINRDGRLDAVVGYEAISTDGKLAWYEQGANATSTWQEHPIATVIGPMSVDVADMDHDGDVDVVVGEHNLSDPDSARLLVFENVDGMGNTWQEHVVYSGDEHHDGAQVVDIDGDGDLDIISIGWDHDRVVLYVNENAICGDPSPTPTSISTPAATPVSVVYLPVAARPRSGLLLRYR